MVCSTARAILLLIAASVRCQLEQAVAVVDDVEAGAARTDGKLHQPRKFGHDSRALVGVGDADLYAARIHADAAGNRYLFLAQFAAQVVAQIADHAVDDVGAIDLIEQIGAALQVEAEHDRFRAAARTA